MAFYTLTCFSAAMLLAGVSGQCDYQTIGKIVQFWDGNPPTDVLEKMVGVYTFVWLSESVVSRDYDRIQCVASILDPDTTTCTGVFLYKESNDIFLNSYNKTENSGKIKIKSEGEGMPDEIQIIISLADNVVAFYQCMPSESGGKHNPFVAIAMHVEHLNDVNSIAAVDNAKRTLTELGINTGTDMLPCDPNVIAIV